MQLFLASPFPKEVDLLGSKLAFYNLHTDMWNVISRRHQNDSYWTSIFP